MLLTFVAFFAVLSVLVLVHELGHFLVAKKFGIYVEEFGFGLPPRLFGVRLGETIYSINWLPFGGFVRLFGEEGVEKVQSSKFKVQSKVMGPSLEVHLHGDDISERRAFYKKNVWVKAGVVVAGVMMNVLLAVFVFSVSYSVTGIPETTDEVRIVEVAPGSPAEKAGFMVEDRVVSLEALPGDPNDPSIVYDIQSSGQVNVKKNEDFSSYVIEHADEFIGVQVERKNSAGELEMTWLYVVPRVEYPAGEGPTGVAISSVNEVFYPWWQMPFRGTWVGLQEAFGWMVLIVTMLAGIIWQLVTSGSVPEGVAGPVGIYQATGEVVRYGLLPLMRFMAILSVNLAVLNILPLPALDGGRLAFIVWEGITGKKIKSSVESWVHTAGMGLLLVLIVMITINDLLRLFGDSRWFLYLKEVFRL